MRASAEHEIHQCPGPDGSQFFPHICRAGDLGDRSAGHIDNHADPSGGSRTGPCKKILAVRIAWIVKMNVSINCGRDQQAVAHFLDSINFRAGSLRENLPDFLAFDQDGSRACAVLTLWNTEFSQENPHLSIVSRTSRSLGFAQK